VKLRAATRSSALARWQSEHIAALLRASDPSITVEMVLVETAGDRNRTAPLHELGGQGIFSAEVQEALLDGRADIAVHSAKDLPSRTAEALVLAAVPFRGDARDALVGRPLDALEPGATIATGSVRRRAQLAALRPDLRFTDLRGNIQTRLTKVPDGGAIVMAFAALERLGLDGLAAQVFDPDEMVPQVGQGALAVECRKGDPSADVVTAIEHAPSRMCVDAERAFLAELGSGCDLPVGAYATLDAGGQLTVVGLVASIDGGQIVRRSASGVDPSEVGARLAADVLSAGGRSLLDR
jgi:hydroxymethylbilane synthase